MDKKWNNQKIIGISEEKKKTLPKGLRWQGKDGNEVKVPPWPHKTREKFMEWCRNNQIGDGFSL